MFMCMYVHVHVCAAHATYHRLHRRPWAQMTPSRSRACTTCTRTTTTTPGSVGAWSDIPHRIHVQVHTRLHLHLPRRRLRNSNCVLSVELRAHRLLLEEERYFLESGFYLEREDLQPGATVQLLVRPALRAGSGRADLALLERPRLIITSENSEGEA